MRWSSQHTIKIGSDTILLVRLPKYDIFARDRAYMEVLSVQAGITLVSYTVTIGTISKSSSEFSYEFKRTGEKLQIDITDIIAAAYGETTQNVQVAITMKNNAGSLLKTSFGDSITYTANGYSPLLDFIPNSAIKDMKVLLAPPTRMLYGSNIKPSVAFLLNGVFPPGVATLSWSFNGEEVTLPRGMFVHDFSADMDDMSKYTLQVIQDLRGNKKPIFTLKRSLQLVDECRDRVLVSWRTPWGVEVEHLFYLHSYNGAKANEKQVDDTFGGYRSVSDMVRSGSFYLDSITDEYDLWYYKSMMRADWVRVQTQLQDRLSELMPMPVYNSYYNVRVTGCSVGDIIADGINSKVLQFEFERED